MGSIKFSGELAKVVDMSAALAECYSSQRRLAQFYLTLLQDDSSIECRHFPKTDSVANDPHMIALNLQETSEVLWYTFNSAVECMLESMGMTPAIAASKGRTIGRVNFKPMNCFGFAGKEVIDGKIYCVMYEDLANDCVNLRSEINFGLKGEYNV